MSSLRTRLFYRKKEKWKTKKWRRKKKSNTPAEGNVKKQKSWCQETSEPGRASREQQRDSWNEPEVHRGKDWLRLSERKQGGRGRVTGFGSRGACCLSGRLWLGGGLCPLHCCLETHRVQICQIFASERQYGRSLQEETWSCSSAQRIFQIVTFNELSSYLLECF